MPGPVADRLELMRATRANLEPILLVYEGGGETVGVIDATAGAAGAGRDGDRGRHPAPALGADRARRAGGRRGGPAAAAGTDRRRAPPVCDLPPAAGRAARRRPRSRPLGPRPGSARRLRRLSAGPAGDPPRRGRPPAGRGGQGGRHGVRRRGTWARTSRPREVRCRTPPGTRSCSATASPTRCSPTPTRPPSLRRCRRCTPPSGASWTRACCTRCCSSGCGRCRTAAPGCATCTTSTGALRAARRSGGTAVLLRPVTVGAVMAVAATGERMPRKSTSFGPKPRTGLVLRLLDD